MFTITNTYKKSKKKMTITVNSDLPQDQIEMEVQGHLDGEYDDEWFVVNSTDKGANIYEVDCEDIGG